MTPLGIVLLLAAGLLATWSALQSSRANPGARLTWGFRNPPQVPLQVRLLRGAAGGMSVLGVVLLSGIWGYWSVLTIPVVWLGTFAIQFAHNRAIKDAARDHGAGATG